jgi:hypothetical protein
LAVSLTALNELRKGLEEVDRSLLFIDPQGAVQGRYGTRALQQLAGSSASLPFFPLLANSAIAGTEFIILDESVFEMGPGQDPNFPLPQKVTKLVEFEIRNCGGGVRSFFL